MATVTVLGPEGPVELGDQGVVVLPGRSVVDVPLDLPPGAYSVLVDADVPLVAAVRSVGGRPGEPAEGRTGVPVDRSWAPGEPAAGGWQDGFAVAWPTAPDVDLAQVELVLLGTDVPGSGAGGTPAEVAVVDGEGEPLGRTEVELAQRRPVAVDLTALLPDEPEQLPAAVVVTLPDGAVVHAAVQVSVGDPEGPLRAAAGVPAPLPTADVVTLRRR